MHFGQFQSHSNTAGNIFHVNNDQHLDTQLHIKRRRISDSPGLGAANPKYLSPIFSESSKHLANIVSHAPHLPVNKNASRSSHNVRYEPELDLNLNSVDQNYHELCKLLVSFLYVLMA